MEKETVKSAAIAILSVVGLYIFFAAVGIGCPIKFCTGVSCAGCGMTRAWIHLLTGDIKGAFLYHPLFLIPAVVAVVFIFEKRIPNKVKYFILGVSVFLFVAVYFYRLFDPSDTIVSINPREGYLYTVLSTILN